MNVRMTHPLTKSALLFPPLYHKACSGVLQHIKPSVQSEKLRISAFSFVKSMIRKSLGAHVYPHGSFALKTYLPDEPVEVSAFFSRAHEGSWVQRVVNRFALYPS
jgi:hypothetical protein